MDPITMAIVAALTAGVAGGATEVGQKVIVDAYEALKSAIKEKFGDDSNIVNAIAGLENEPDFKPNQNVLAGRVAQAKADQDEKILAAAEALLDKIKAQPDGEQHIQTAIGSYIAQADRGSTATVKVNQSKE